jgi:hypothetical protein
MADGQIANESCVDFSHSAVLIVCFCEKGY